MKSIKAPESIHMSDEVSGGQMAQLEILVDELIKDSPQEARIRAYMKAAGLQYSDDPIARMSSVLEALDGARKRSGKKTRERDTNI